MESPKQHEASTMPKAYQPIDEITVVSVIASLDYDTPWLPILPMDLDLLSVQEKVSRFHSIGDRRKNVLNPDVDASQEMTIFDLITKPMSNLSKENLKHQFDINTKRILRTSRTYFDHKLEICFEFKKIKKRISRSNLMDPALNKGFIYYVE